MRFTDERSNYSTIQVVPRTKNEFGVRPESIDFWGGLFKYHKKEKDYGFQEQVQRSDNGQD